VAQVSLGAGQATPVFPSATSEVEGGATWEGAGRIAAELEKTATGSPAMEKASGAVFFL
jgi:hypothetical protein